MDWSKAKNILIVALIATNIFLMFTYITKNETEHKIVDKEALFTVLEGRNIFVDTQIPDKYENMPAITIEYNNDKQDLIEKNLKRDIYNISADSRKEAYHKAANQFLKDCQLFNENLVFDKVVIDGKSAVVKYKNCYKEIAIGDSFIKVTFFNGKIQDVTRQLLTPTPRDKKKLKVTSPEEALLMFMSEKDSEEAIHVEKIELVFWVNNSGFDGEALVSDTAFPAWEITYNGGQTKYIDAYKA